MWNAFLLYKKNGGRKENLVCRTTLVENLGSKKECMFFYIGNDLVSPPFRLNHYLWTLFI